LSYTASQVVSDKSKRVLEDTKSFFQGSGCNLQHFSRRNPNLKYPEQPEPGSGGFRPTLTPAYNSLRRMNKLRDYGRPNAEAVKFSYIAGLCADPGAGLICTNAIAAVPQSRPAPLFRPTPPTL